MAWAADTTVAVIVIYNVKEQKLIGCCHVVTVTISTTYVHEGQTLVAFKMYKVTLYGCA